MAIQTFQEWPQFSSFAPFVKEVQSPDFSVTFRLADRLPAIADAVIHEENCYRVHPDGRGGYVRSFFNAPRDLSPYAVGQYRYDEGTVLIDCLQKGRTCVSAVGNSFFHIGFEAMLIRKKRLCLHASLVQTHLGGILFSGPSGVGKSTQAQLWTDYRGARQINGDRPILEKSRTGWRGWGSPYAGSSGFHLNESCPVTAVVILQQENHCTLRRLRASDALRAIWQGLTMYSWDKRFVEDAYDLAMDLVGNVPVFQFCCTPDEYAVEYLEQHLRKECGR